MTAYPTGDRLLDGLSLVVQLTRIRDARLGGDTSVDTSVEIAHWRQARAAWWAAVNAPRPGETPFPLARIADRLGLDVAEVDLLLVLLAPHVDAEALNTLLGDQHDRLFRGLTVDVVLGLLYPTARERFAGNKLLSPMSGLVANELVELVPIAGDLGLPGLEVRLTESVANFLLERPLVSGVTARYCTLMPPSYAWDSVILPETDKEQARELVRGVPGVQSRLDEWGFGAVMPRSRGVVLMLAGPPGTGKEHVRPRHRRRPGARAAQRAHLAAGGLQAIDPRRAAGDLSRGRLVAGPGAGGRLRSAADRARRALSGPARVPGPPPRDPGSDHQSRRRDRPGHGAPDPPEARLRDPLAAAARADLGDASARRGPAGRRHRRYGVGQRLRVHRSGGAKRGDAGAGAHGHHRSVSAEHGDAAAGRRRPAERPPGRPG